MAEEQQKIQKYIIKSTPYGELNDTLKDLEKLAPFDPNAPTITNALEQYNEEHLTLIPLKNSAQAYFPIMNSSKVSAGRYVDQVAKKIYTVDHIKGEIISMEDHDHALVESV